MNPTTKIPTVRSNVQWYSPLVHYDKSGNRSPHTYRYAFSSYPGRGNRVARRIAKLCRGVKQGHFTFDWMERATPSQRRINAHLLPAIRRCYEKIANTNS